MSRTTRLSGFIPLQLLTLCLIVLFAQPASGSIIMTASGHLELELDPFFSGFDSQTLTTWIGFSGKSRTLVGSSYSVGGVCVGDYNPQWNDPGEMWFTTYLSAHTSDAPDGGGGHARVDLNLKSQAAFYYRLEAVLLEDPMGSFSVSFNGQSATATYDFAEGFPAGSFPLIYKNFGGTYFPVGWDTYVIEGFLPKGSYDLSAVAGSTLYHEFGQGSSGLVSLLIQLQGDTDMDGYVGLDDLDTVLSHWGQHVPVGQTQFGDVSHDGFVGLDDLDLVLDNWNADVTKGSIIVPEPTALSLLGVVYLGLICGRGVSQRQRA